MTFRVIDLFSGAGGLTAGFLFNQKQKRFAGMLAIDNDQASVQTYNKNFGDHGICTDIEDWLANHSVPNADVVIGGPPCQGFSLLNKNRKGDKRRALWEPFMEIVQKSGASVFVMENVQGLLKSEEFQDILHKASEMNFLVHYQLLNTADYGVPQTRKRAIVVGIKNGDKCKSLPYFPPTPTHNDPKKGFLLPPWEITDSVIGDLEEPVGTELRNTPPPYDLHFGRKPTELSKKRYRMIPPGGNRFDLQKRAPEITPKCWLNKPTGSTDLFGRLWNDRPSVTIRTEFYKPEKGRYLHPTQNRPITHREAARLMSFPDEFIFMGSKIEIAKQIGNAVPPKFAAHIADYVYEILEIMLSKEKVA